MECHDLIVEFETNSNRYKNANSLADKKLYLGIIDQILDEWNQTKTQEFEPISEGKGSE